MKQTVISEGCVIISFYCMMLFHRDEAGHHSFPKLGKSLHYIFTCMYCREYYKLNAYQLLIQDPISFLVHFSEIRMAYKFIKNILSGVKMKYLPLKGIGLKV